MSRILLSIFSALVVGMAAGKLQSAYEERTTTLCFVAVSNVDYQVEFTFDGSKSWRPATNPPGVPHYDSDIRVTRAGELVATLRGQWTYRKCYEDEPTDLVERALWVKAQRNKPGTNAIAEAWIEHGKLQRRTTWVTNDAPTTYPQPVIRFSDLQWAFTNNQFVTPSNKPKAAFTNEWGTGPDPGLRVNFDGGSFPTNTAGQAKKTNLWIWIDDLVVIDRDLRTDPTNRVPMVIWVRPEAHRWLGGPAEAEERARKIIHAHWLSQEVLK